jgi:ATP-binding cassette subfamily G (WHITE) protein 2 (SNQ2)
LADKSQATILVTLYQAGNGIFNLFEKVLVLDKGRQIYYGPRQVAKSYFENLGFVCPPGANIADFLTSVTVATERQIKPGFEISAPKTAEELEAVYLQSDIAKLMEQDMQPVSEFAQQTVATIQAIRDEQPHWKMPFQSSYTVGMGRQIAACVVRFVQKFLRDNCR